MIKHLKFYFLNRIVKDPIVTAQIYNMMYHKGPAPKKEVGVIEQPRFQELPKLHEVQSIPKVQAPRSSGMIAALNELKSKSVKTKQDKESIGILEAALKNGYK